MRYVSIYILYKKECIHPNNIQKKQFSTKQSNFMQLCENNIMLWEIFNIFNSASLNLHNIKT